MLLILLYLLYTFHYNDLIFLHYLLFNEEYNIDIRDKNYFV